MQVLYRRESFEDVERIIAWCRENCRTKGGPFEVYSDPGGINRFMVAVNSLAKENLSKPLGSFYCNYITPGGVSLDENPHQSFSITGIESNTRIKILIDLLFKEARPGAIIDLTYNLI